MTDGEQPELETPAGRPRLPSPTWDWWDFIPVFFIALLVGGLLALFPLVPGSPFYVQSCAAQYLAAGLTYQLGTIATVFGWIAVVRRGRYRGLGPSRNVGRDLGAGTLAGAGLIGVAWVAAFVVMAVIDALTPGEPPSPEQVPSCVTDASLVPAGVMVIVLAPVAEELLFRGLLYRGIRRRLSFWPAALISGAVFGVAHFQTPVLAGAVLVVALFTVGLGLAAVYERRQSILAPMAAHAVFNVVGFLAIAADRL